MGGVEGLRVALGKRIFLDEQAVGHHAQAQPHMVTVVARHAEHVGVPHAVAAAMRPRDVEYLGLADACRFEGLVQAVVEVVAPHLGIVHREAKRLHMPVAHRLRVGGGVVVEDHLAVLLDGAHDGTHIAGVLRLDGALGQPKAVEQQAQLAAQVLLEKRVAMDGIDRLVEHMRFLLAEAQYVVEVLLVLRRQTVTLVLHDDDEPRPPEVVEVTVDARWRCVKQFRKLLHAIGVARCQNLYQVQLLDDFWVVVVVHDLAVVYQTPEKEKILLVFES